MAKRTHVHVYILQIREDKGGLPADALQCLQAEGNQTNSSIATDSLLLLV